MGLTRWLSHCGVRLGELSWARSWRAACRGTTLGDGREGLESSSFDSAPCSTCRASLRDSPPSTKWATADARLLSTFQHQADPSTPPSLSQTELYTAYAARFSSLLPSEGEDMGNLPSLDESIDHAQAAAQAAQDDDELKDFEANMAADDINAFLPGGEHEHEHGQHGEQSEQGGGAGVNGGDQQSQEPDQANGQRDDPEEPRPPPRLLNPVELIALARMTFPKCEPAVDEEGRFVIRGIERREGVEKGRGMKMTDMFPFALATGESRVSTPVARLLPRLLLPIHSYPLISACPSSGFSSAHS